MKGNGSKSFAHSKTRRIKSATGWSVQKQEGGPGQNTFGAFFASASHIGRRWKEGGGEREEEAQRRTLIKCHKQRDKKEGRYEKRKA